MKQAVIENTLRRVNEKFIASLDETQKQQAIAEFKTLFQQQMSKASLKLYKAQKVYEKYKEKQNQEENLKNEIKMSLNDRMEVHLKKRETYQLQKIKNYQRMQLQWKDKLKLIKSQIKDQQKQNILLSNRLSKQSILFWQSKQEKQKNNIQIKPNHRYQTQNRKDIEPVRFLTQADGQYDQNQKYNFPTIKSISKLKQDNLGSKSQAIQRRKSQSIRNHIGKSNQFWKLKEQNNLQKVMQKMQKIQRTRSRAKQHMIEATQHARDSRIQKQKSTHKVRFLTTNRQSKKQKISNSFVAQKQQKKQQVQLKKKYQSSKVQKRRKQLFDNQFQDRSQHFEYELKKQKKGEYRKVVRQAVNLLKLQALKSPAAISDNI